MQVSRPADEWRLSLYDFDSGEFDPADVPILVAHPAFGFVPANSFTNFLGPAGGGAWTLPETENTELLYLGIGTSGIAPGTFANNQVHLQLRALNGPGHFALYNVDPFGGPVLHMNSRDGINPAADSIALSAVGGHVHVNWAFSAPGTYRVGLSASGHLAAGGQTNTSPVVEYTFNVQDIPWRPRLRIARASGAANFRLTVQGETGRRHAIQFSTNLQHWTTLTNFIATAPVTEVPATFNPAAVQFFRALTLTP